APRPEGGTPTGRSQPGTGRLGAEAYAGARLVACRHEALAVGQRCPGCGQGTLYPLPAGVEMRIDGHALLSAICYEVAKLRCSASGGARGAPPGLRARCPGPPGAAEP